MASENKNETKTTSDPRTALAARLFEKMWAPRGAMQITEFALAAYCFAAAGQFLKVASQINEGRSPEEILAGS